MSAAKSSLKSFLNLISGAFSLRFLIALTNQKVFLPFYHTISDNPPPHVKHLYPVRSVGQFIDDLNFLQKHYEFINLEKFIDIKENNQTSKRYCFLTFDDGLSEFYNIVAPILKERNIPAHVFLNSGFVNNQTLMFRYKVSIIIDKIKSVNVDHEILIKIFEVLNIKPDSKNDINLILFELKYEDTNMIDQIALLLNINFDDYLREYQPYMADRQIDELLKDGFSIGAHSIDHPEYRFISFDEQINQTSESINYIRENYGSEFKTFAFPFTDYGVSFPFFEKIKNTNIADYTFGGAGLKKEKINTHFQRFPMEEVNLTAKKMIKTEYLYFLIKMPFGKNIIKR